MALANALKPLAPRILAVAPVKMMVPLPLSTILLAHSLPVIKPPRQAISHTCKVKKRNSENCESEYELTGASAWRGAPIRHGGGGDQCPGGGLGVGGQYLGVDPHGGVQDGELDICANVEDAHLPKIEGLPGSRGGLGV